MARIARIILPNQVYLVTHRADKRGKVFFSEDDRRQYLEWLKHYADEYKTEIWAYCLMPDQVQLLVVGRRKNSLAQTIGRTHMRYSRHVNSNRGWEGSLWADRFSSTLIQDSIVAHAARFVECNPVREKLEKKAEKHRWSSARAHALGKKDSVLCAGRPFPGKIRNWAAWLKDDPDPVVEAKLARNMTTGRPTGTDEWLARLEKKLGLPLVLRKRGPKPKAARPAKAAKKPARKK
jgi:putative transposase